MFTANEAFRAYVSGVLPELGEREIAACTYADLFRRHLKGFSVESALAQTEALLGEDPEREMSVRAAYDPDFIAFLRERLAALPARFRTLSLFGQTVLPAAALKEKYAALTQPPGDRLALLKRWAREEIQSWFAVHKRAVYGTVMRATSVSESTDAAYEKLKETFLRNAEEMIGGAACTDAAVLCRRLYTDFYGDNEQTAALKRRLESKKLRFEEGVLLLWIRAALGLCRERNVPTHILIDEAQDYAPLQHETIRLLYPGTVFTLLADVNQGIVPAADTLDPAGLAAVYGAAVFTIGKSYRSTKPIGAFAKRYLPGADYELFDRAGKEPVFHEAADPAETAAEIVRGLPESFRTVGVILKTAREARRFGAALKRFLPESVTVAAATEPLRGRVVCLPAALAKGLEFDAVILPDFREAEKNARVAYLMTTRALHELHLIV